MPLAAKPVIERIAEAIIYRLQLLAADYSPHTAVSEVIRPLRMGGFTPKHMQIVLTQLAPQRVFELDMPGNPPANAYALQFNIRCHVMPSEKDTTPVDEVINTFAADVIKVVGDTTTELEEYRAYAWTSFRGLAIDAEWQSQEAVAADGGPSGVNVPLIVTYRVQESDPYQLRA